MNYTEMTALYRNKVRKYTPNQCRYAVRDIYDTLRLYPADVHDPYVRKLYCELDQVRERLSVLTKA